MNGRGHADAGLDLLPAWNPASRSGERRVFVNKDNRIGLERSDPIRHLIMAAVVRGLARTHG